MISHAPQSIVVNPGDVSQWKKALSYSGPSSPLIFLNRSLLLLAARASESAPALQVGGRTSLRDPSRQVEAERALRSVTAVKGVEQVYYLKRISKGWVFRQYPGPWQVLEAVHPPHLSDSSQALVEKPDGTVECVATYNKRPLLREVRISLDPRIS